MVVAFVGWLIAGVLPIPLGPSDSSAEVVAFFASGARVPMGIVLASIGVSLVIPLVAAIGYVMYRERGASPLFALVQLVAGSVTCVCLLLPIHDAPSAGPARIPRRGRARGDTGIRQGSVVISDFMELRGTAQQRLFDGWVIIVGAGSVALFLR